MSVTSVNDSGNGIFQYLQRLNGTQQTQAPAAVKTDATQTTPDDASGTAPVAGGHHRHRGGGGELFTKVQQAVTSALESAKESGSDADPNAIVQDAIAGVLKDGPDSSKAGSTSSAPASPAVTETKGDNSTSRSAFAQLLQSYGVDAQQFHKDFQSAIQSAREGGSTDGSGVLANFPKGTLVDTTA